MANESGIWPDLKFMCARGGKIDTEMREKMEHCKRERRCQWHTAVPSMWLARTVRWCARVVRLAVLVRCTCADDGAERAKGLRVVSTRSNMGWEVYERRATATATMCVE